ncbi:T9SS type B sorting domain-containing protein [Rufibacter latericius]|uniref:Gliding motility-associated C-terminal domain-containing protein n=1 Tax=Rufibacter latericius TaxID=2487040 RepID=A0A3M9MWJ1_9BACT|nr:gliding motility-associated C-terminal domain-containing protein [Rufibacter latericius]RNI29263.1 gliding motility-associated C-terminal domain-containing protein [Rufibacter latericius]
MPLILQKVRAFLFLLCGLFLFSLISSPAAQATHLRAGNIYVKSDTTATKNPLRFFFTLETYSVAPPPFEDLEATLYFGDCTSQRVPRESRTLIGGNQNGTFLNIYRFEHIYSGPGTFTVTFVGENRNGGVVNISSSVQQTFFLQSTLTVDPFLGINRSPILQYDPVDVAVRNQIYIHNPGGYDPDGDSLSYKMLEPRVFSANDACGNPTGRTAPGYRGLENFLGRVDNSNGRPTGLTLDRNTGQLTWNTPGVLGEFNIAFVVEEWRNGRLIGQVIRDMQIFVREDPNRPPVLIIPRDTCIVAGTLLRDTIRARDPDRDPVIISAVGSMLPPATFPKLNDTTHIFNWQTTCLDVRRAPYQVLFRAEDQPPSGIKLVDLQPWRITIVGPPPVLVSAVPQSSSSIRLNWNPYTCPNATTMFIYRKEGPSDFRPDTCTTGIPASAGYTLVGQVSAGVVTFLDNNNGQGLERNKTYCYRIYAEFPQPAGGSSIASNEVCATLESISLTKVSVVETSTTTGKIRVEWSKPRPANIAQLTAPFSYRLSRVQGQNRSATAAFAPVTGYTFNSLNDTVFTDNNLNTEDTSYTYKVEFFHSGTTGSPTVLVDSSTASSVRLSGQANGPTMVLNWTYNVPWNNASTAAKPLYHVIFLDDNGDRTFVRYDSVQATATSGTYSKEIPLQPGREYCVYVQTRGTFDNPFLPDPILNNSQEVCLTRLCVPVLEIDPLVCDENFVPNGPPFTNTLTWRLPEGCNANAIDFYTLYYRETEEGEFVKLATIDNNGQAVYQYLHQNLVSYAGCYVVTATDANGVEGEQSNIVCKDNCIVFSLPNIFTPNGDGRNDVFTPKQGATFIKRATLRVFNRWGNKVFEGSGDPALNWRGVDNNGKALSDATYFYQVEVEFYGLKPDVRTFKGWVEIVH